MLDLEIQHEAIILYLSLCLMEARCSMVLTVVSSVSFPSVINFSKPCCTLGLPEKSMTFKNARTSQTILLFGCDSSGTTYSNEKNHCGGN